MGYTVEIGGAIIALFFTYFVFESLISKWQVHQKSTRNGCQAPPKYPNKDPILGLDLFFENFKQMKKSNLLNTWVTRFQTYGHTFSAKVQTKSAICTVDAENLKTVHATNFTHFGVQPLRNPPTMPFLGEGVFTMDGPFWEHSRALIRPTFSKSNVANLPAFEVHLQKFLALVPTDGTKVDLKPLLNKLVCVFLCLELYRSDCYSCIDMFQGFRHIHRVPVWRIYEYAIFRGSIPNRGIHRGFSLCYKRHGNSLPARQVKVFVSQQKLV